MKLSPAVPTPSPLRLGHVHLRVRSLEDSVRFYNRTLGLRFRERVGRYVFLAADQEHHSVALEEIDPTTVGPPSPSIGIAHVAFEVVNRTSFVGLHRKLLAANIPVIMLDNGISWTMQLKDPDENEIEIYVDRRRAPDGIMLWGGYSRGLLDINHKAEATESVAAQLGRPSQRLLDRHNEGRQW